MLRPNDVGKKKKKVSTFKNVRKELQKLKAENGTKNMDTRIIASANSLGLNRRKGR